jgi:hypothetical protein
MEQKRYIEVFSAGCPICREAVREIQSAACPSCKVLVLDMNDPSVADRANALGIKSVPAVVIDGELAGCCAGRGPDMAVLKHAGIGNPIT